MNRTRPNVLITGTPGTGKTTTADLLARELGFRHINVGEWVREKGLHSGWNQDFECYNLDEDKVRARPGWAPPRSVSLLEGRGLAPDARLTAVLRRGSTCGCRMSTSAPFLASSLRIPLTSCSQYQRS